MILHCNFEELRALAAGAELVVAVEQHPHEGAVAAPPEAIPFLEELVPRLSEDLSITTLAEQHRVREAVNLICDTLRARLEDQVVQTHPADEDAVANYFDFAHTRAVLHRLDAMGGEMSGMIELMTGHPPTEESAESVNFPD